jgi:hypothetical protein
MAGMQTPWAASPATTSVIHDDDFLSCSDYY